MPCTEPTHNHTFCNLSQFFKTIHFLRHSISNVHSEFCLLLLTQLMCNIFLLCIHKSLFMSALFLPNNFFLVYSWCLCVCLCLSVIVFFVSIYFNIAPVLLTDLIFPPKTYPSRTPQNLILFHLFYYILLNSLNGDVSDSPLNAGAVKMTTPENVSKCFPI